MVTLFAPTAAQKGATFNQVEFMDKCECGHYWGSHGSTSREFGCKVEGCPCGRVNSFDAVVIRVVEVQK